MRTKPPKKLEQLRRSLPSYPPAKVVDKYGDVITPGFAGNVSASPRFITDGHVLVLRSAINPMMVGDIPEWEGYYGKKVTEASIDAVWGPATIRKNAPAEFIGCANKPDVDLAVIRDVAARIVLVNLYLLSFIVAHTNPDFLNVAAGDRYNELAISFYKKGELVALLMPMRYVKSDIPDYYLDGPAVPLHF